MIHRRKMIRRSVLPLCVGIMVFMSGQGLTEATPGYRMRPAVPSGVELAQEMVMYDPAVLSIRFAQNSEISFVKPEKTVESGPLFAALQQQPRPDQYAGARHPGLAGPGDCRIRPAAAANTINAPVFLLKKKAAGNNKKTTEMM